jgi:DNA-binding NarL/FixJ family response regulator
VLPPISRHVRQESSAQLDADSRALVGMLLDGASEAESARTLGLEPRDVRHAVQRILSTLRVHVPAAGTA